MHRKRQEGTNASSLERNRSNRVWLEVGDGRSESGQFQEEGKRDPGMQKEPETLFFVRGSPENIQIGWGWSQPGF